MHYSSARKIHSVLFLVFTLLKICKCQVPVSVQTTLKSHREAFLKGECRGLHEAYTGLHRRILSGQGPQRYLVYVSPPSGIADRLAGMMSALMVALLTGRALQIVPHPMAYEALYDQPFINWTIARPSDEEIGPVLWPPQQKFCPTCAPGGPAPGVMQRSSCAVCLDEATGRSSSFLNFINEAPAWDWHMQTDLRQVYPEADTLYYSSNRGCTVSIFQNMHHQRQLYRMGLRPSTAFGCMYNYLLFPRAETLAVVEAELAKVMAADVVIGVQIRTDDRYMQPGSGDLDNARIEEAYKQQFVCAESLERSLGLESSPSGSGLRSRSARHASHRKAQEVRSAGSSDMDSAVQQAFTAAQEEQHKHAADHASAPLQDGQQQQSEQQDQQDQALPAFAGVVATQSGNPFAAAAAAQAGQQGNPFLMAHTLEGEGGEQAAASRPLTVRWLLVTDSFNVRHKAVEWYGNKIITYRKSKPTHLSNSGTDDMMGSRLAVAEHWLFGMTDYQVVSWWSGYGRTAAMRAMREGSVLTITGPDDKKVCGPDTTEHSWQLGHSYSGAHRLAAKR